MAEHRVEITIKGRDEGLALGVLEALERHCPELGPVMVEHHDAETAEYVLGVDAENAIDACADAGARFVRASGSPDLRPVSIVELRAHRVPTADLDDVAAGELQPA